MDERRSSQAALRNREPITEALSAWLGERGRILEVASGTGEHAIYFASRFPGWTIQPTDLDTEALLSIEAWRQYSAVPNVDAPVTLDVCKPLPDELKAETFDALFCANMIHISPWETTPALFTLGAAVLSNDGVMFTYGPYLEEAVATAPSNEAFDLSLRERNAAWGIRSIEAVDRVAEEAGFHRAARIEMPANNLLLVFKRG